MAVLHLLMQPMLAKLHESIVRCMLTTLVASLKTLSCTDAILI